MSDVYCDREKCIYNVEGGCSKAEIQIDDTGGCEDYESNKKYRLSKGEFEGLGFE